MPGAGRDRRLHIFHLAQHDDRGSHDARRARDIDDGERDDGVERRRPEHGGDADRQQHGGKRHQRVVHPHQPLSSDRKYPASAPISVPNTALRATTEDADDARQLRAPDHARPQAAAEIVGAEREVGSRADRNL